MIHYPTIVIEISGVCNAKCPYCENGRNKDKTGSFIEIDLFDQILSRLSVQNLLNDIDVQLFCWGEPFLHPELEEIIKIANKHNIRYSFSTNASIIPRIDNNFIQGLNSISFSMPGFSQEAYNKIHGFDFEKIVSNIKTIVLNLRNLGYKGSIKIIYHVYQFNLDKIHLCRKFAQSLGVDFCPQYAILNKWDLLWGYHNNSLQYEELKEISQNLFSHKFSFLEHEINTNYRCPQYDILVIDENANTLICCQSPKKEPFFVGNIISENIEEIEKKRESSDICKNCNNQCMAQYINSSLQFPQICDNFEKSNRSYLRKIGKILKGKINSITRNFL